MVMSCYLQIFKYKLQRHSEEISRDAAKACMSAKPRLEALRARALGTKPMLHDYMGCYHVVLARECKEIE